MTASTPNRSASAWRVALPVALAALAADQASKWWIQGIVARDRPIEILPFFNLVYAENRGISFSLLHMDSAIGPYVLSALALAIVAGLLWWLRRVSRAWPATAGGLVMGGAVGNVIDRLAKGAVFDFLDVHVAGYHWPAFNLADSAITVGVAMLLIDGLFARPERAKT
jgi:signal peptidase II